MLKNLIIFFSVLIIGSRVYAGDAFALPSVRQLGTNVPVNTEKTVVPLPSLPKVNTEEPKSVKIQADKGAEDSVRLPITTLKTINSARIKQPATSASSGTQPSASGVSDSEFNEIVGRVQALEAENRDVITGVTESGSGNYVKDVSVDTNNKLNVEKTRVLYAPVRNDGSNAIVGDAEIWVVR